MARNNEKKLSQELLGDSLAKSGWRTHSKAITYNDWFFSRLLNRSERRLLECMLDATSSDNDNQWETNLRLSTAANWMGVAPNAVSRAFKALRQKPVECPICGVLLCKSLVVVTAKGKSYTTDLSPLRDVIDHLQQHRAGEQNKTNYDTKKAQWLARRRDENAKNAYRENYRLARTKRTCSCYVDGDF